MTHADVLVDLVHAIDTLDWTGVRAALADELTTDYTSLFGGSPQQQTGDELVEQWQARAGPPHSARWALTSASASAP